MKETTQPIATAQTAINPATNIDKVFESRDRSLVTDANHEAAAAACCSTSEQTACCEPTEKAACCGTAGSGGCGCR
ncbi:MAG TPA: hypothetical protein PLD20_30525 [Blastocatellia bacterium]|nr:hypothetical protein [Blastocatellia bacterium]HMV87967.1 hypothetical protein [Blastocatellia bacterium]HMX24311.1 hypothetical protein [Blastocatellia bacterium]HMY75335.1 hypothetical protein [Blastocatellia bacterium]HMZ22307.1 hypothetical protein [Blastocatellia bacterium]